MTYRAKTLYPLGLSPYWAEQTIMALFEFYVIVKCLRLLSHAHRYSLTDAIVCSQLFAWLLVLGSMFFA